MKLLILASPPQWGHQEMSQGTSTQSGGLGLMRIHPQGSLAKANGGGHHLVLMATRNQTRVQSRKDPVNPFYSRLWFDIYTGGLKRRRGFPWMQLLSPVLTVFLRGRTVLSRHNTNESGSLTKTTSNGYS